MPCTVTRTVGSNPTLSACKRRNRRGLCRVRRDGIPEVFLSKARLSKNLSTIEMPQAGGELCRVRHSANGSGGTRAPLSGLIPSPIDPLDLFEA